MRLTRAGVGGSKVMPPDTSITTAGVIDAASVYTMSEFKRRSGMKDWSVRTARRAGMPVRRCPGGSKLYILGADFIKFLEQQAEQASRE
jgi:hypothetical protein